MVVHVLVFFGVALTIISFTTELTAFWTHALWPEREGSVMVTASMMSWPSFIAACARRLHDIGLSARWLLIWPAAGAALVVAVAFREDALGAGSLEALDQVIVGWFFGAGLVPVALLLPPGRKGSNRFGPDPRRSRASELAEVFR